MISQKLNMLSLYCKECWQRRGEFFWLIGLVQLAVLVRFAIYMMGQLELADKVMAFLISGKIPGTSYELKLRDVVFILVSMGIFLMVIAIFKVLHRPKDRPSLKIQNTGIISQRV